VSEPYPGTSVPRSWSFSVKGTPQPKGSARAFVRNGRAIVTEKAFSQQVVDLARLRGWKVYRTWNSMHSPAGFPDLVLARGGRLIHVELKAERGQLSTSQRDWLLSLADLPGEVYVWKPSNWPQIEAVLL